MDRRSLVVVLLVAVTTLAVASCGAGDVSLQQGPITCCNCPANQQCIYEPGIYLFTCPPTRCESRQTATPPGSASSPPPPTPSCSNECRHDGDCPRATPVCLFLGECAGGGSGYLCVECASDVDCAIRPISSTYGGSDGASDADAAVDGSADAGPEAGPDASAASPLFCGPHHTCEFR